MHDWTSHRRLTGTTIALLLLAGLLPILSSSARSVRAGDPTQGKPLAADLAAAIRNADVPSIRKLLAKRRG